DRPGRRQRRRQLDSAGASRAVRDVAAPRYAAPAGAVDVRQRRGSAQHPGRALRPVARRAAEPHSGVRDQSAIVQLEHRPGCSMAAARELEPRADHGLSHHSALERTCGDEPGSDSCRARGLVRPRVHPLVLGLLLSFAALSARAPAEADGAFAAVVPGYTLQFPRDYGSHPQFRIEWWYVTGWLTTAQHETLGFQITFFRSRPALDEPNPSDFAPHQILIAHCAISDPAHGGLWHDQRVRRAGLGLAEAQESDTRVWIDDWQLERQDGIYLARARAGLRTGSESGPDAATAAQRRGRLQPEGTGTAVGQLLLQPTAFARQWQHHARRAQRFGQR